MEPKSSPYLGTQAPQGKTLNVPRELELLAETVTRLERATSELGVRTQPIGKPLAAASPRIVEEQSQPSDMSPVAETLHVQMFRVLNAAVLLEDIILGLDI